MAAGMMRRHYKKASDIYENSPLQRGGRSRGVSPLDDGRPQALGHQVSTIDPDELCEQFGIDLYRRALLQRIAAERPDILIVYPPYDLLRERKIAPSTNTARSSSGFAYDDPIFLPSYVRYAGDFEAICTQYRKLYDVYFTTSRQMVKRSQRPRHHLAASHPLGLQYAGRSGQCGARRPAAGDRGGLPAAGENGQAPHGCRIATGHLRGPTPGKLSSTWPAATTGS